MKTIEPPVTIDSLRTLLETKDQRLILTDDKHKAKLEQLLDQVNRREVVLEDQGYRIVQHVRIVVIDIHYRVTDTLVLHLQESVRIEADGKTDEMQGHIGIGKKLIADEPPEIGAIRYL